MCAHSATPCLQYTIWCARLVLGEPTNNISININININNINSINSINLFSSLIAVVSMELRSCC
ncbi:hypothetical protein Trco_004562 [Trichoderma cornu-damae]|uniref:Uncharacterized protein n=1 Tax=Trichoderma cornu-damae TaxID=654480 RepID=A0A9P8QNA6_9HYPO|nr:hypothetical protein Trco_004562 [Trichoderma cornu-damae]